MVWLFVLGLLAWAFMLSVRVAGLRQRADALERRLLDLTERLARGAAAPARPETQAEPETPVAAAREAVDPPPGPPPGRPPRPATPEPVAAPARAIAPPRIVAAPSEGEAA